MPAVSRHSVGALIAAVALAQVPLALQAPAWTALPGLLLAAWWWRNVPVTPSADHDPSKTTVIVAAAAVMAVAVVFRGMRLDSIPPGLYVDEVHLARNIVRWRTGLAAGGIFGAEPLGRPGWVETSHVYLALAAPLFRLGGDGWLGIRLISVVPSLIAVALTFAIAQRLAGGRAGLLAAFFLAASHWAARLGRCGWDEVMMTALQLAAVVCLERGVSRGRPAWSVAAGLALGLCLHTYIAARLVFVQLALWPAWEAARARSRRWLVHGGIALGVAAAMAAPHYLYLARRGALDVRTRELSLVAGGSSPSAALARLGRNAGAHLAMFHGEGGRYARDNVPGRPLADPLTGAALLAGVALLGARSAARPLLVSWFAVCVMGGVLSQSPEGAPYPYRVGNLAPWMCVVAALGVTALWPRLGSPSVRAGLAAAGAGVILAWNGLVLFRATPASADVASVFGTMETRLGRFLAKEPSWRPCIVQAAALQEWRRGLGPLREPDVNGRGFFTHEVSLAAIHAAAGAWRVTPQLAVEPRADNPVAEIGGRHRWSAAGSVALPAGSRPEGWTVREERHLTDDAGRVLCTLWRLEGPAPASTIGLAR
jgi:dolichyl-phosphate-mannose-protein mannosyltransferase